MTKFMRTKRTERIDSLTFRNLRTEEEEVVIEADTAGEIIVILEAVDKPVLLGEPPEEQR